MKKKHGQFIRTDILPKAESQDCQPASAWAIRSKAAKPSSACGRVRLSAGSNRTTIAINESQGRQMGRLPLTR